MQQEHQRQKQNPWIVTGAAVLAVIVVGVLIVILTPRQKKVEAPPTVSAQEWQAWAMGVEGKAYDALTTQGVKLTQNSESGDTKLPSMSLVDGKPSFGVAAADAAYLRNAGALTGKIALFQENIAYGTPYMPYDSKTQFPLHDEVVDRTPYLDDQHQVAMPFSASRYAQTPQDCDTLVIMRSFMVAGAVADVDEYSMYVDTEVIIINARTGRLQHLEYLGKCLADKNAQNPSFWMMRGEAMRYLASLSVDGKASKTSYITPHESGSAKVSDDKLLDAAHKTELLQASGYFGSYNTLAL